MRKFEEPKKRQVNQFWESVEQTRLEQLAEFERSGMFDEFLRICADELFADEAFVLSLLSRAVFDGITVYYRNRVGIYDETTEKVRYRLELKKGMKIVPNGRTPVEAALELSKHFGNVGTFELRCRRVAEILVLNNPEMRGIAGGE